MRIELFCEYGCYLGNAAERLVVEYDESVSLEALINHVLDKYAYPNARLATEEWVGMHGFELDECECLEDEDAECNCDRSEEEDAMVEDACDYTVALWDEEEHSGLMCGTVEGNTVELDYRNQI